MIKGKFNSDDWDYVMKTNPDLRRRYQEMISFNELNPVLAKEIDDECIKRLNPQEKDAK
jgi:hypothetical protein